MFTEADFSCYASLHDVLQNHSDDFVGIIHENITTTHELLSALYEVLNFPGYFSYNWNALEDCLSDLDWVTQKRVVIVHKSIPKIGNQDYQQYLDVLKTSIESWKPEEEHELLVYFPTFVSA
ncbi:hypothetical protein EHQ47_04975 [Leptospira bourretii]|uniref:barstar family protein n=1 Tax=Leptospira bourretii TaxID=2484962 RepID=UPI0010910FBA|nr:barstar family protein [Leptospira bourretii]TGL23769.1 hypothetical protein EHQ47_04975 [Leptospira bourretii]